MIGIECEADRHIESGKERVYGLKSISGAGVADVSGEVAVLRHVRAELQLQTSAVIEVFSPTYMT